MWKMWITHTACHEAGVLCFPMIYNTWVHPLQTLDSIGFYLNCITVSKEPFFPAKMVAMVTKITWPGNKIWFFPCYIMSCLIYCTYVTKYHYHFVFTPVISRRLHFLISADLWLITLTHLCIKDLCWKFCLLAKWGRCY